jgi:hypothetical protein
MQHPIGVLASNRAATRTPALGRFGIKVEHRGSKLKASLWLAGRTELVVAGPGPCAKAVPLVSAIPAINGMAAPFIAMHALESS